MLEVERALERPAEDIASTRVNRANILMEIPGCLEEAKSELEDCLLSFQRSSAGRATVLSSLADVFDRRWQLNEKAEDLDQAITLERRALALRDHLPIPADRAASHNNLANRLKSRDAISDRTESMNHQLAALLYRIVVGHGQDLQTSFHNYTIDFLRAQSTGTDFTPPRVADLLADPAFAALERWLRQQQVSPDALQADVDDFLEQVRQAALSAREPE
jgi:hypothetical protein